MKNEVYFGIVWRIVLLFVLAMLGTFISDMPQMREFFGDVAGNGCPNYDGIPDMDCDWIWGTRHYWYYWMMFLLFIVSLINAVVGIINLIDKHY